MKRHRSPRGPSFPTSEGTLDHDRLSGARLSDPATVYTTNRRVWEHDDKFKDYLTTIRATAIDMETATIFIVGFVNHIPKGALLLVSDSPMTPEGVKTGHSDLSVSERYVKKHLEIGIDSLIELARLRRIGETHAIRVYHR